MNETVNRITMESGSRDPFEIAAHFGVPVRIESWHPVTLGEFDRRSGKVTLNSNSPVDLRRVLAHELGHYFLGPASSEADCDRFAAELLAI